MGYKLIIFDLDGTLIDSLADITDSFNIALQRCGRNPLTIAQVRSMIGTGMINFLEQALGKDTSQKMFDQVHRYFVEEYANNLSNKTVYYPGIPEMLRSINGGRTMAVLSNKNTEFIKPVLDHLSIGSYFPMCFGGNNPYGKKPSPAAVEVLMKKYGVSKEETIIIGDMSVDIRTAQQAGISSCSVFWGYGIKEDLLTFNPDHTAETPDDILSIV